MTLQTRFTPPRAAVLRARLSAHGLNLPDGYVDIARAFLGYRVERAPLIAEWDEAGDAYLAAFGDTPDAPDITNQVSAAPTQRAQSYAPDEHTAKLFAGTRHFKLGEIRRLVTLGRLRTDLREVFESFGFTIEAQTAAETRGVRPMNDGLVCAVSVPAQGADAEPRGVIRDKSATYTFHPDAVLPGMKYYQPSVWEMEGLSQEDRAAFFTLANFAHVAFFGALLDLAHSANTAKATNA